MEAGRQFAALTFSYVDAVTEHVTEAYESERERCLTHRNTVRARVVEELIAGARPDLRIAESALGYRLRQYHLGVVLWTEDLAGRDELGALETVLGEVANSLEAAGPAMVLPRDQNQIWGWIPDQPSGGAPGPAGGCAVRRDGPPSDRVRPP